MSFINYRDAKFCWHCHLVTQVADPITSVILWLTPIEWINRHLAIPTNLASGDNLVEFSESPQSPAQSVPTETAEVDISRQSPALLISPDNSVIVNIPIGSVAEPLTLQYEPVTLETVPCLAAGYSKVVRAVDLTLTDSQQTGAAVQLEQSTTVTVTLNDGDIHLAGGDETNFVISTFKSGQDIRDPLVTRFDPQNMTVSEVDPRNWTGG